jgi:hypothetical protein
MICNVMLWSQQLAAKENYATRPAHFFLIGLLTPTTWCRRIASLESDMTFEKTAPGKWYVSIAQFGDLTCGPFKTKKAAKAYAEKITR